MGGLGEDRLFVNLFGISALELLRDKIQRIWEIPLLLISAPGGGKSSLMRIFSPGALKYISETAKGNNRILAEKLSELGAFKNKKPYILGVWIRISDEYQALQFKEDTQKRGLFWAMLNSRIIICAINAICEMNDLIISKDLKRITFSLKPGASSKTIKSWEKWGAKNGNELFDIMANLETELCEMTDDPFWKGEKNKISHTGLWSLDLLAHMNVFINKKEFNFKPLVMLDDVHELADIQLESVMNLVMSRHVPVSIWLSFRKHALGLADLLSEKIGRGVEKDRDYYLIDLEKYKHDFRKRVLDISNLRVQIVAPQMGGSSQDFIEFISDEREEIFLKNLNADVASDIKKNITRTSGKEINRFQNIIKKIENKSTEFHDLCKRLRMLEILIQREINNPQRSFSFSEISDDTFQKHESKKAIVEAAELFLANEFHLPYYFGAQRLIALSSYNIQQFLKIAGTLFEEIMMAIRLGQDKDSFLSPMIQHDIICKIGKNFLKEIPRMMPFGNYVYRFVNALGEMCRKETYRPTAPYAPGTTGTALTMYEIELLSKKTVRNDEKRQILLHTIKSAIAHNILEAEPNYKCKGKEFLVLYLNRLLCVPFNLPLQRGGFREKKLSVLLKWIMDTNDLYEDSHKEFEW